ncbi:hypothetical protein ACFP1I_29490 [Dyadobacter subterraneus]|uniref:YiaAB two helix domain-containing protein n=1 Tax=Dyadobacter subterraneus TaxID=2773304 RepID=A0ABR9WKZ7_9BACT|nr:hypothetical protein [Dyadobacter subterraneus]MBE9466181.1 hypothetical protein [Dyadobacter subterraneus]
MKIYYNKKQRNFNIGLSVILTLGLMAIHGRESFNPNTYWFWATLVQAFFLTALTGTISFKKTDSNPDLLIGKED